MERKFHRWKFFSFFFFYNFFNARNNFAMQIKRPTVIHKRDSRLLIKEKKKKKMANWYEIDGGSGFYRAEIANHPQIVPPHLPSNNIADTSSPLFSVTSGSERL